LTTDDADVAARPRRLLGAVAVQAARPSAADLVSALRRAVEDVVVPALAVDLVWSTTVITRHVDLDRGTVPSRPGLDWAGAADPGTSLEAVYLLGRVAGVPAFPPDPRGEPVHALLQRGAERRPATLAVSVHEWALDGGQAATSVLQAAARWLLSTAEQLRAETGYVAVDLADSWDAASAWELAVQAPPAHRDVTRTVWGYGWGTLLSAQHAEAGGGIDALAAVPGADVRAGPDGRVWVRLGADPASVSPEQVAALRTVLTPVLPTGLRRLENYLHPKPDPYADPPVPYLL
jgi:hypothetical protein